MNIPKELGAVMSLAMRHAVERRSLKLRGPTCFALFLSRQQGERIGYCRGNSAEAARRLAKRWVGRDIHDTIGYAVTWEEHTTFAGRKWIAQFVEAGAVGCPLALVLAQRFHRPLLPLGRKGRPVGSLLYVGTRTSLIDAVGSAPPAGAAHPVAGSGAAALGEVWCAAT